MKLTRRHGAWWGTIAALFLIVTLILAIPTAALARNGGFHGGGHGFHGGGVRFGIGIGVGWPLWYGYPYYGYPAYPYYPYYGDPYAGYPPVQYGPPASVAPSPEGCYDAYGNWVAAPCQPYATR